MENNWYQMTPQQVVDRLHSDRRSGLTIDEAECRYASYGPNQLIESESRTAWIILSAQLKSSLVVLLLVATAISLVLGEYTDAIAIAAIILLNTILGFWQDYRAEKSLAELKKLSVPDVLVLRDRMLQKTPASELVPGDIVQLQTGYFVPADCRILEMKDLSIDESALTGESLPVEKKVEAIAGEEISLGDQSNRAFAGTVVVRGHAMAIVTTTGMTTQLGQIADSLQQVEYKPTPLQIRLAGLSRSLAILAVAVVFVVMVAGLIAGQTWKLMVMTALSLAVAIVPEGLPAVATVALAIGARRMFKRNALIRQLPAVETLGSVSVICSDKTGTLTQNRMTVTVLDVEDCHLESDSDAEASCQDSAVQLMLLGSCLCNDAVLQQEGSHFRGRWTAVGEPTETALVEAAAQAGLIQSKWQSKFPRIEEIAFDSVRKRMTTVHQFENESDSGNDEDDGSGLLQPFGLPDQVQ